MAKIKIGIFDGEAELLAFDGSRDTMAEIKFQPPCDGFVTMNGITAKVSDGVCSLDLRLLDEGRCTPVLIRKEGRTILPEMKKSGRSLTLIPPDGEFIRALSLRERLLSIRLSALEARINELGDKIDGGGLISLCGSDTAEK